MRAGSFVLHLREDFLKLVDEQKDFVWAHSRQHAFDGVAQTAGIFPQLAQQTRRGRGGYAGQHGVQFLQGMRAGRHVHDDPVLRTGDRAVPQGWDQPCPCHAGFAAAAGPHNRQEAGVGGVFLQPPDQLRHQIFAPEKIVGIFLPEGAQPFEGVFQPRQPPASIWPVAAAQQIQGAGMGYCLGAISGVQFAGDVVDMRLDRADRQNQLAGNFPVGHSRSNQLQHFQLTFAELGGEFGHLWRRDHSAVGLSGNSSRV